MEVKMKDIYGTDIEVSESGSGYFRMDFNDPQAGFVEQVDKQGNKIPVCISLNEDKATVLMVALKEYLGEKE
jgi:hypothetical protein